MELFVKGDMVWFSEVSPRPHDTGMVTMCSQRFSECDLHARAILGLPVDVSLREAGASAVIYGGVDSTELVYNGLEAALGVPSSDVRLFGKPASLLNVVWAWHWRQAKTPTKPERVRNYPPASLYQVRLNVE